MSRPSPSSPSEAFRLWLEASPGPWHLGQLHLRREDDAFWLCHENDVSQSGLLTIQTQREWRKIIFFNDKGSFRPLKAAPDFATGWQYGPLAYRELYLALQYAYPATVPEWFAHQNGKLQPTPWQETAERQTGRFKVVAQLQPEQQARLVREHCAATCEKHRLWLPGSTIDNPPLPEETNRLPLLCPEACNYLVGKAREILKGPMD